ncbi:MAG: hypothetical protein ACXAAI_05015 [Promethearchaeota archaeon]|jgi:hypothetical protein
MENPKNTEAITILNTDKRTDFSLPYLVYTTRTVSAANPIMRKIHASVHNVNEGIATIDRKTFFIYCILEL